MSSTAITSERNQATTSRSGRLVSGGRGPLLGVAAVVVGGVLVATSRYGIGIGPDSVTYLDGARSLADGHGYAQNDAPITAFAPGYSAVLSVLVRFGLSAPTAARLLAVMAFVATTWVSYVLVRRHVRSPRVVMVATVFVGCSAVLLSVFEEALSEHLFIIDVLLLLIVSEELARHPR